MTPIEDWIERCRQAYRTLSAHARATWKRDLPLAELVFDRWERARELGFGDGTSIYHSSHVFDDVAVGPGTWIGPHTILDGTGGLRIGRSCSVSAGVQIYTHHTVQWALSGGKAPYEHAPTVIEDCCYLGPYAVVSKGVVIGHHSVIGAHTLVNRSVGPYSIVFGTPGRVVGRVEVDDDGRSRLNYFASGDPAKGER